LSSGVGSLSGDPVLDGAQIGAQTALSDGASSMDVSSADASSSGDGLLDTLESDTFNKVLMGGGATVGGIGAGMAASAGGASVIGAVGTGAATAVIPLVAGIAGAWAGGQLGSAMTTFVMDDIGLASLLGLQRIATDGEQPSVLGHMIAHQNKNAGLWGALAGLAVGVAAAAFVIATGGTGLVVLAGAALAGGFAGGLVASVGATIGQFGAASGSIVEASTNVFFEGRGVARAQDKVACDKHGAQMLAEGCKTVAANGRPIVRLGHRTTCDANVNEHVKTIFVTKETAVVLPISDSRSKWLRWTVVIANIAVALWGAKKAAESVKEEGIPSKSKTGCKDPIDAATGEFIDEREDFSLPGLLPIVFRRCFANFSKAQGGLGPKWANSWSINLRIEGKLIHFQTDDGCIVTFHAPDQDVYSRNIKYPHLELRGEKGGELVLFDKKTQQRYVFSTWAWDRLWLSRILDRNDNAIEFIYNSYGLYEVRRSNGDVLNVESRNWKIYRVSIYDQELVQYVYDRSGFLKEAHSFQNGSFFYDYDERGYVLSWRDTKATQVLYAYDALGRVVETHSDSGQHNGRLSYDDARKMTRVVDPGGAVVSYHHDGKGLVWKIVDAFGGEWTSEYDVARNVTATVDPLGRRTSHSYNDLGLLTATTTASGATTKFAYRADGLLTATTQRDGSQWSFDWDDKGNLLSRTNPLGETTSFRHGPHGETLRVDLPNGAFRSIYYQRDLRPAALRDGRGFERLVSIDALGRVLSLTDQEGHAARYDYTPGPANPRGDLKTLRLPDGSSTSYEYDGEGQLSAFTDGEGRTTRFRSGAFDLLEEVVDARGGSLHLAYDGQARLSAIVNQKGERYLYEYDQAGQLVRERDFGGLVSQYVYDAAGQRITAIAPDGAQFRFAYDLDGLLIETRVYREGASDPEDVIRYGYDVNGFLRRAQNKDCLVELERDALGRVVAERVNGRELRSTFDKGAAQRTARSGDVTPLKLDYDTDGFVASLQIGDHAPLKFERDRRGREMIRQSASGFLLAQAWNEVGLLTRQLAGAADRIRGLAEGQGFSRRIRAGDIGLRVGAGVQRAYQWDHAFNPTEIWDEHWGATRYSYDARGQVSEVRHEGRATRFGLSERFDYDAAGNLALSEAIRTRAPGLSPEAATEIAELAFFQYQPGGRVRARGRVAYDYDAAGRVIRKRAEEPGFRPKTWLYAWSGQGRLARCVTPEGVVWSYGYDPFGRRLWKCRAGAPGNDYGPTDGGVSGYAYQWDGHVLATEAPIYADGTIAWDRAVEWHHEPGSFRPLARQQGERLDYVVTDHLGTPRELLDESGARLRWRQSFTLWGRRHARITQRPVNDDDPRSGVIESVEDEFERPPDISAAPELCPIRYQGQWEDAESGLYYNRFRYYDPLTGGYLSPDPIGLEGGLRPQGYVENPTTWVDPWGLASCSQLLRDIENQLASGRRARVDANSRAQAEEILRAYTTNPDQAQFGAYRNTTGQPPPPEGMLQGTASDWLPGGRGAYEREGTYHWDEGNPNAARGDHALEGSHLQIHDWSGKIIRVFY
jgi:RHS repeat-associated protein